MANSVKIDKFLSEKGLTRKDFASIHQGYVGLTDKDVNSMNSKSLELISKKINVKFDKTDILKISSIAKKLSADEFLACAAGDNDSLKPVKLTNEEMQLLKAGSWRQFFALVASGVMVTATLEAGGIGAFGCANTLASNNY